jgi:hypothetical protein
MALTDDAMNNGMVLPVQPMGGNNGFGFGDGSGIWFLVLFFLLCGNNGWGGGFGGGFDGGLYPWMNQSNQINGGFRDQMLGSQIQGIQNSITSGFGDVQTSLCNGFAGVNATINSGFAGAEASANARQMANMNQAFAAQTAMAQGFNGLQAQFADCCCENRLANCQTQNIIQNEGNATRFADANNTRDLLTAFNSGIQSIKDQLCEYRNDQKDETIANLRQELMFSRGQASQVEQTAQILANNNAQTAIFQQGLNNEVDALYNRLNSCPVPTTPVYGRTPIFTCQNNGCGCGNNF